MTPTLRQGIDRDIYQVLRKLEDETGGNDKRLTVTMVYDAIKRSNSSLSRQKKRPLEDSIERVLSVRKHEVKADLEDDSDIDMIEESGVSQSNRESSLLNKQIAKSWNLSASAAAGSASPQRPLRAQPSGKSSQEDAPARLQNGEAKPKKRRKEKVDRSAPAGLSTRNLAGIESVIRKLHKPIYQSLERSHKLPDPSYAECSILLCGPAGCGKTTLAGALAADKGCAWVSVSPTSLVSGTSGESEKNIRDLFDEAMNLAPSILFIDEIDAIAGKRDSNLKGMESRMLAELSLCMDKVSQGAPNGKSVVVLAATRAPDNVEPAIRGRFNHEVSIPMPDLTAREAILKRMARQCQLADDVDFRQLAKLTPGYVGADLKNVTRTALRCSLDAGWERDVEKGKESMPAESDLVDLGPDTKDWLYVCNNPSDDGQEVRITQANYIAAIADVQPAAKREGFSTIPDTTWDHVGGLGEIREALEDSIIGPIDKPEEYEEVGLNAGAGILLWGPPGTGKTLVAKAVANESKANFISIKGPELLNKYVGESERAIRQVFTRARSSIPCILFFDEMDAIAPRRGAGDSDASSRVVNTLLTELDGVGDRTGIYVIGATNRPDVIDPAIRRPGRLGQVIFVGLPSEEDRVDILRKLYEKAIPKDGEGPKLVGDVARRCRDFTGADLAKLLEEASKASIKRRRRSSGPKYPYPLIVQEDWDCALAHVKPSVKDVDRYSELRQAMET